jgi:hypothetical protein
MLPYIGCELAEFLRSLRGGKAAMDRPPASLQSPPNACKNQSRVTSSVPHGTPRAYSQILAVVKKLIFCIFFGGATS